MPHRAVWVPAEDEDRKALREVLVTARKAESAAAAAEGAWKSVNGDRDRLARQVAARRRQAVEQAALRTGTCVLFGPLAFVPLTRARRALARERKEAPASARAAWRPTCSP